jgi:hypothetical protein
LGDFLVPWYEDAIIYAIDIKAFQDSEGDQLQLAFSFYANQYLFHHNRSRRACTVQAESGDLRSGHLRDRLDGRGAGEAGPQSRFQLGPYACRWFGMNGLM